MTYSDAYDYDGPGDDPDDDQEDAEEADYWDEGRDLPVKEEPDCYACGDGGCPACGYIDPDNPEHRAYLAAQIIETRAGDLTALTRPATDAEIDATFINLPDAARQAVSELVQTALVSLNVTWINPNAWGTPGTHSTESPF